MAAFLFVASASAPLLLPLLVSYNHRMKATAVSFAEDKFTLLM
jgi:hypothetical protein